jgi:copper chaperone NosL
MRKLILLAVLAAAAAGVVVSVLRANELPDAPQPIAWDREPCASCRMHIGEPAFAAQLILTDGRVLNFDDPGCLFDYLERDRPDVHRAWVHHKDTERWIPLDQAGFVRVARTPMGHGFAAVDGGTSGAVGWLEVP